MNLENMKYDAFISYRHCELDQFVAVTLHKELEAFRLPKSIQKQLEGKGIEKKKIERVFRDRDELPITNNLADPITNALRNSEFLLVICSPRLSESMWCRKEIETFISMHGREKIFAVLIEGEPSESFPEELLYDIRKTVDENGNEHVERIPIEPLAADVRGKNKAEIRKKIKEEVIRLAAPMFGCGYDDLKQRHRERMMRRIITGACAASVVFGSFGAVSTTMALRIQKQSVQIKEQAGQIEAQYHEALKTNAKQMAEDAFDSMESGDMVGAARTAYKALTKVDEAEMPYTADAEYALSSALQTYSNGEQILPQRMLQQESQVNFCKLSPDRSMLAVVDKFGNMQVYNPLTGEVLYGIEMTGYATYLAEEAICFIGNTEIAYPMESGFCIYNFETKEVKEYPSDDDITALLSDKEGKYLVAEKYGCLTVYDAASMKTLYTLDEEEAGITLFLKECAFSEKHPGIIACEYDGLEDETGICLIDVNEQKHSLYAVDLHSVTDVYIEDEEIFFCGFMNLQGDDSKVCSMDFDGNLKWTYPMEGTPQRIKVFGKGKEDKVSFTQYGRMTVLNRADGSVVHQVDVGHEITNYVAYKDSDGINFMTRDGQYYYYFPEKGTAITYEGKFVAASDNIKEFDFGYGYFISAEHNSDAVIVYEMSVGDKLSVLLEQEEMATGIRMSPDGTHVAFEVVDLDVNQICVYDVKNNKMTMDIQTEDYINDLDFNSEGKLVVLLQNGVKVYNPADGTEVVSRATETENIRLVRNCEAYVASAAEETSIIDVKTGDVLSSVAEERIVENGLLASCVDEDGLYYAFCDEENKKVVVGSFEDEKIVELPLKVNAIQLLAIAPQTKTLYVTYLDDSVEAYDFMTGNLVMNYGILNGGVENVTETDKGGITILYSDSKAFLVNEAKEVISFLQGYTDYNEASDSFILDDSYTIYEVKRYETEDLLQEAQELLKE